MRAKVFILLILALWRLTKENWKGFVSVLSFILSASSIIIALMTVASMENQLNQQINHDKLSVRPMLKFSLGEDPKRHLYDFVGVRITNAGLGPAIVDGIYWFINGNLVAQTAETGYDLCMRLNISCENVTFWAVHGNDVLQQSESRLLFDTTTEHNDSLIYEDLLRLTDDILAVVKYRSSYDEVFLLPIIGKGVDDSTKERFLHYLTSVK